MRSNVISCLSMPSDVITRHRTSMNVTRCRPTYSQRRHLIVYATSRPTLTRPTARPAATSSCLSNQPVHEHRAPSTEHRAPGTEHRARSTERRAVIRAEPGRRGMMLTRPSRRGRPAGTRPVKVTRPARAVRADRHGSEQPGAARSRPERRPEPVHGESHDASCGGSAALCGHQAGRLSPQSAVRGQEGAFRRYQHPVISDWRSTTMRSRKITTSGKKKCFNMTTFQRPTEFSDQSALTAYRF